MENNGDQYRIDMSDDADVLRSRQFRDDILTLVCCPKMSRGVQLTFREG